MGITAFIDGDVFFCASRTVEVTDSSSKFVTLLPLQKQLSDFLTPPFIFDRRLGFLLLLILVLIMDGTETILGVASFMIRLCIFRFNLPDLLFF